MYRKLIVVIFLFIVGASCTLSRDIQADSSKESVRNDLQTQTTSTWRPATYLGIELGTSGIDELIKELGSPSAMSDLNSVGNDRDLRYVFDRAEFPSSGQLAVWVDKRTKVIHTMEFAVESLKRKDLNSLFGSQFQITKYAPDSCVKTNFDASAIYESNEGELSYIEYRSKGIAVVVDESVGPSRNLGEDRVTLILYLSKPLGPATSQCR